MLLLWKNTELDQQKENRINDIYRKKFDQNYVNNESYYEAYQEMLVTELKKNRRRL